MGEFITGLSNYEIKNIIESGDNLLPGIIISVLIGLFVTIAVMTMGKRRGFSLAGGLVGVLLIVALSFQIPNLISAFVVKSEIDEYEMQIDDFVQDLSMKYEDETEIVMDVVKLASDVAKKYFPSISRLINDANDNVSLVKMKEKLVEEPKEFVKGYIVQRFVWCGLFVIVAIVLILLINNMGGESPKQRKTKYNRQSYDNRNLDDF